MFNLINYFTNFQIFVKLFLLFNNVEKSEKSKHLFQVFVPLLPDSISFLPLLDSNIKLQNIKLQVLKFKYKI
jgi:hypothetical protein